MTGDSAVRRTTRYTLVGAACAVTYNAIMIAGSRLGANYISLFVLAYLVMTPTAYALHTRFTFAIRRSWQDFARFSASVAASFPINFVVITGLCSGLHLSMTVAAPVTTVVMYLWNYASTHWALYRWVPFARKSRGTRFAALFEHKDVGDNPARAVSFSPE
jgi:putative flippase GtrA